VRASGAGKGQGVTRLAPIQNGDSLSAFNFERGKPPKSRNEPSCRSLTGVYCGSLSI